MAVGVETTTEWVVAGGVNWRFTTLKDRSQFHDPGGLHADMGVHENVWPIFGQLWPTARILADALGNYRFSGERVLELGCGLALISMVLHQRGIDVLASDIHPLAKDFLQKNCANNGLSRIPFRRIDWTQSYPDLARFPVIVASDVLYENGMAPDIARFIDEHGAQDCRVFVSDPGRSGRRNKFTRAMEEHGFDCEEWQDVANVKGRIMTYVRGESA